MKVTAVGGWPGDDARAVAQIVRDTCEELPHLPELPERGAGAEMIGRAMAMASRVASDFAVTTVPTGWQLTSGRGRDLARADSFWAQDLDTLEEVFDGYVGDLKVQMTGPFTLAASVEDRAGEKLVRDHGAVAEMVGAVRETWRVLLADVQRRIPGARLLMQVDEPLLADVLAARVKTGSGLRSYRAMEASVVTEMLRDVRGDRAAVVHCCAADIPLDVISAAGFAPSFDLALVGDACIETVGTQVDAGGDVFLGINPATVGRGVAQVRDLGSRVGYESRDWLEHVVLTPPCDLLAMPLSQARGTIERLVSVARALREED